MRIHFRVVFDINGNYTFQPYKYISTSSVYKITYIIDLLTKVDINLHLRVGALDVVSANNGCDVVGLLLSSHDITQFSVVVSLQFKS